VPSGAVRYRLVSCQYGTEEHKRSTNRGQAASDGTSRGSRENCVYASEPSSSLSSSGPATDARVNRGKPPGMLGSAGTVPPEAAERTAWLVLRDSGGSHQWGQARRVKAGLVPPRPHPGPISATNPRRRGRALCMTWGFVAAPREILVCRWQY
jgi:hypothetical protein